MRRRWTEVENTPQVAKTDSEDEIDKLLAQLEMRTLGRIEKVVGGGSVTYGDGWPDRKP